MVLITYVACASFHASREAYVAVKGDFQRRLHFPTQLLGLLDTTFLVCYGLGLLFSGSVGARFGNKRVASVGLAGTAVVLATHGCLSKGWFTALPDSSERAWRQGASLHVPLVAASGLIQSLGFPNLVAVTSGWVDPERRGLIMGLWSTTGAAGDIIGLNVATYVLESGVEWQNVFFVISGYLGVMTVVFWLLVEDRGVVRDSRDATSTAHDSSSAPRVGNAETAKLLPLSLKPPRSGSLDGSSSSPTYARALSGLAEAWNVPGVLDWSLSYFFIKTVTYTILFWMPYYLTLTLDSQASADNLTVLFDVCMILGTTALGLATDALGGARSPLFVCSFCLGSLPLLFLPALKQSTFHYAAAFAVVGFFSGGPAHMYGTAVSVDLGEMASLGGEASAPGLVSSLSGLIDGIGTLGAAVGQSIVARIASEGERRDAASGLRHPSIASPADASIRETGAPVDAVETLKRGAGGETMSAARIVADALAAEAYGDGGVRDLDAEVPSSATSATARTSSFAFSASSSLGTAGSASDPDLYAPRSFRGTSSGLGSASSETNAAVALTLSDTVDDGFQIRWSRVFLMLFVFNVFAAATLLRVAAWELKRAGWFSDARKAPGAGLKKSP
jgi:sugar phosphate permease